MIKVYNYIPPVGLKPEAQEFLDRVGGLRFVTEVTNTKSIFGKQRHLYSHAVPKLGTSIIQHDLRKVSLGRAVFVDEHYVMAPKKSIELDDILVYHAGNCRELGLGRALINTVTTDDEIRAKKKSWWATNILHQSWGFYEKLGCQIEGGVVRKEIDFSACEHFELDEESTYIADKHGLIFNVAQG